MTSIQDTFKNMQRGPADAVGLDIGASGIKAVRAQKHDDGLTVSAVDILPAVQFPQGAEEDEPVDVTPLAVPPRLRARYGCMALSAEDAVIKLMTFPGPFDQKAEGKVLDNMGLEDADRYRIAYKIVTEGHGRSESRVLTVAVPDESARHAPLLLPSGYPVPFSLEVSGLASMATLQNTLEAQHKDQAVAAVDFGAGVSTFAIFNRGMLALVRRFGFGTETVMEKMRDRLGVDAETAQGIVTDGAFDISQLLNEVMDPLVKQLVVSRDFVERRENCHVSKLYVCGGLAASKAMLEEMQASLEVDVDRWDPFEGVKLTKDALPEAYEKQRWRFAAALGACMGTFEET